MISKIKYYIVPFVCFCVASVVSFKLQQSNIFCERELIHTIFNDPTKIKVNKNISLNVQELQRILNNCELLNADIKYSKTKNQRILKFQFKRKKPINLQFYFQKEENMFILYKIDELQNFQQLVECIKEQST